MESIPSSPANGPAPTGSLSIGAIIAPGSSSTPISAPISGAIASGATISGAPKSIVGAGSTDIASGAISGAGAIIPLCLSLWNIPAKSISLFSSSFPWA